MVTNQEESIGDYEKALKAMKLAEHPALGMAEVSEMSELVLTT